MRIPKTSRIFLVPSLTLMVITLACISVKPIYYDEDIKEAEDATSKFHQMLNSSQFEQIYDMVDVQAKATKSKADFVRILSAIRGQMGKSNGEKILDSQVIPQADFREVRLIYETSFENGVRKEEFVWYVRDNTTGLFEFQFDFSSGK